MAKRLKIKDNNDVAKWGNIKPYDIVRWCNDEYLVLENNGASGVVVETFDGGGIIKNFHWKCGDETCQVVHSLTKKRDIDT